MNLNRGIWWSSKGDGFRSGCRDESFRGEGLLPGSRDSREKGLGSLKAGETAKSYQAIRDIGRKQEARGVFEEMIIQRDS